MLWKHPDMLLVVELRASSRWHVLSILALPRHIGSHKLQLVHQINQPLPTISITMKFFKAIASVGILFLSSGVSAADYKRGENKEQDALYDIQTGMAGIQQAAKDPALLAQLIQDMQVRCRDDR